MERRQELTNHIEQLSKVILERKSDVREKEQTTGAGQLGVLKGVDSRYSRAGNQGKPKMGS